MTRTPTCSPRGRRTGRRIAFTTDRFSTDLPRLDAGDYRLALIDVASGEIRALPAFTGAKNINPQWSRSGDGIYFLSDTGGATNVYRVSIADGALFQLTDLITGASGITALSPALSVAARADRLAFSVYESENYEIYAIDDPTRLAGWPVAARDVQNADLIPGGKAAGKLLAAHADPERGLADAAGFSSKPYKAKLGLDFVGQPSIGAGYGQYGGFVSGGVALSFSDMLGEHSLYTVVNANSVAGFNDIGGRRLVHQPRAPVQLGRAGRAAAVRHGRLRLRLRQQRRAAGVRRADDAAAADGPQRRRPRVLPVRPLPPARGAGRAIGTSASTPACAPKGSRRSPGSGSSTRRRASTPATRSACSKARSRWCATPPCSEPRAPCSAGGCASTCRRCWAR